MAVDRRSRAGAPGQHFLRSSRLAAELVLEAGVAAGDLVVEIGAGAGVLTQALTRTGADVIALEVDPVLALQLRRRLGRRPNVTVVEDDALDWTWPNSDFAVVSNLPFARSGAILGHLLHDPRSGLRRADVIVQWEFASKHAAIWPATLRGTYWRAWFDVSIARRLARTAFSPTPGVDAALLRIVRRPRPLVPAEDHGSYWKLLAQAFRSEAPIRKLRSERLSPLRVKRLAPVLGFAPDARPRDLDARQWAGLFVGRGG